ncbi:Plexin domain-containing protein [Schistosoma japonicum]|nr:Plexin domain-containing protein [Schistosoma japonicum]
MKNTEGYYYTEEACLDTPPPEVLKLFPEHTTIPNGVYNETLKSSIEDGFKQDVDAEHPKIFQYSLMTVPRFVIKTGTSVYLKPKSTYCSKQTSKEACEKASLPGIRCNWCQLAEKCSDGADTNAWVTGKYNCTEYNDFKSEDNEMHDQGVVECRNVGSFSQPTVLVIYALMVASIILMIIAISFLGKTKSQCNTCASC